MKNFVRKIMELSWYSQLAIALTSTAIVALLVKFLIWFVPFIGAILVLLFVFTNGEIFSTMWESYKQSKQTSATPLVTNIYHWLTENGVTELSVSTLQFVQGVEYSENGVFFIHLDKEISDELLANFATKVRQVVKTMSNDSTDCVVSRYKREPFLAIKVRLVSTPDMMLMTPPQREEDF